jgi:hypothetical protein
MSFSFYVQLIKVFKYADDEISRNCTHVKDDYWIFEGDPDCLESKFEILADGIVGSLGGLSEKKLIELCDDVFGVTIP